MIRFFGLIALCIFNIVANAQNVIDSRNDLQQKDLKGSVMTLKTYEVMKLDYLTDDELKSFQKKGMKPPYYKKEWVSTIDFNRAGYITKSRCPESWTGDNYDKTYRQDNQMLTMTRYEDDGSVSNVYSMEYDEYGFISYAVRRSEAEVIFKEFYTCDNQGRLLRMIHNNHDGSSQESKFEYLNGKLTKWSMTKNDKPYQTMIFDGGFSKLKEAYAWNGNQCSHVRMKLGATGLPEITERETGSGEWYVYIRRTFDSYGNITKEIYYNENGTVANEKTMSYKYDSHGNWIRKETKGNGMYDNKTEVREILYY